MPVTRMVHRALPGDAGLMAAIHVNCFAGASDRPWDEAAMAQLIACPGVLCLLGAVTHVVAAPTGLLIARVAADEAEILTLGVAPACRRAGLGRALLTKALEYLRASGAERLFLEVDESNEAAMALYRSLGAESVGRRASYYESGADAAVFSLDL
ncbi:MAG TPA: GNAT family N-acetyltransferase [Methyloceanibacter sp.]|nr:GNAT family N-acetyltransferase [Methyloceanibacter sp.]